MPSDANVRLALDALAAPARAYHASLAATADDIRAQLRVSHASLESRVTLAAAELGPLAVGRIDMARFAALFLEPGASDPQVVTVMEQALSILDELAKQGDSLLRVNVAAGNSLYVAVAEALAEIGRGFAAARAVSRARAGHAGREASQLPKLPFSQWTRSERRLAPPLVVEVAGNDLRPAALAEFMDGRLRIVLVVDGQCPPAALVRLVGPGTFVLQTNDGAGLARLAAWNGPAVAALMPDSAARFVHDPAAGTSSWERLEIVSLPERAPRQSVAGLSVAQQVEDLELLKSLAARPPGSATAPRLAATVAAGADPVDRLASWLLSQVDLSENR